VLIRRKGREAVLGEEEIEVRKVKSYRVHLGYNTWVKMWGNEEH
jgi:hypothetical protein